MPPAQPARAARPLKLLIVYDNVDGALTLAAFLTAEGHETVAVHTAREALARIEDGSFDVAVLDIGLPDMSGIDLARRIRHEGAEPPVMIALTGFGQEHDRLATANAGFAKHLVRPVKPQDLLDSIYRLSADREREE